MAERYFGERAYKVRGPALHEWLVGSERMPTSVEDLDRLGRTLERHIAQALADARAEALREAASVCRDIEALLADLDMAQGAHDCADAIEALIGEGETE